MENLKKTIQQLNSFISRYKIQNPSVSKGSIGWHIEHSLQAIDGIIIDLKNSDPKKYTYAFNIKRFFVFIIGKIPRGKAESPERVNPQTEHITEESLRDHIEKTLKDVEGLQFLNKNNYFIHPVFGYLNTRATITCMKIHTNHHIFIINDIIKSLI